MASDKLSANGNVVLAERSEEMTTGRGAQPGELLFKLKERIVRGRTMRVHNTRVAEHGLGAVIKCVRNVARRRLEHEEQRVARHLQVVRKLP